jgi:hypothetical protein
MSQPRSALARLHEELKTIEIFDRVHEHLYPDPPNDHRYEARQARRKEIMEEIAKLEAYKPAHWNPALLRGAIAIICAIGYAMVYYSLK